MADRCLTTEQLNVARDAWFEDRNAAEAEYGPIGDWNFCAECSMEKLFYEKSDFNEDISGWDVGEVVNMYQMFDFAAEFNQDLSGWDVSKVTRMRKLFESATKFNQDLSEWDVSKVTSLAQMFNEGTDFNKNISEWDVSRVTEMGKMFGDAISFNQNLSEWDVSQVTKMKNMFNGASSFNNCLDWDLSNVETTDMFVGSNGSICTHSSLNPSIVSSRKPSSAPSTQLILTLDPSAGPTVLSSGPTQTPSMAPSDVLPNNPTKVPTRDLTPSPTLTLDPSGVPASNSPTAEKPKPAETGKIGHNYGLVYGMATFFAILTILILRQMYIMHPRRNTSRSVLVNDEEEPITGSDEEPEVYREIENKETTNDPLHEPLLL
uniref:BspA family leucine-rich repeat surface protein n=2 Tax=Corethron hystrix TaxID=216773 RepID=A0A7S1FY90_9STRA|mmetsp:Transcript_38667/g.89841  ORF Transcript_38667/g.89841 Transcript_38667/m.89841 type:complete len:376 (+) Transcript_38667:148-1275(+)